MADYRVNFTFLIRLFVSASTFSIAHSIFTEAKAVTDNKLYGQTHIFLQFNKRVMTQFLNYSSTRHVDTRFGVTF